jgi:hypothetical protein
MDAAACGNGPCCCLLFFGCFLGRLGVILIMGAPQGGAVTVGLSPRFGGAFFSFPNHRWPLSDAMNFWRLDVLKVRSSQLAALAHNVVGEGLPLIEIAHSGAVCTENLC